MFNSTMYYTFFASALLIYGISLNRLLTLSATPIIVLQSFLKSLGCSLGTTILTYAIMTQFLVRHGIGELYPFVAILVFVAISGIIELCVAIGLKHSITEFSLPMLSSILALNEAKSFPQVILICASCVCAFYLLYIILCALRRRISIFSPAYGLRIYGLLMVSLGVIAVAVFAWQNSWIVLLKGAL